MDDAIARFRPQPRHPPLTGIGQIVKPLKAEIAEIGQHQRARRQGRHQIACQHLLRFGEGSRRSGSRQRLAAHVEDPSDLARQQGRIAGWKGTQGGQAPRHRLEGRLIDDHHVGGKRRELQLSQGWHARVQIGAHETNNA